jgi:hypothetical protein
MRRPDPRAIQTCPDRKFEDRVVVGIVLDEIHQRLLHFRLSYRVLVLVRHNVESRLIRATTWCHSGIRKLVLGKSWRSKQEKQERCSHVRTSMKNRRV